MRPDEHRWLKYAALFYALGLALHTADHLRRGLDASTSQVLVIGNLSTAIGITVAALVVVGYRHAPILAARHRIPDRVRGRRRAPPADVERVQRHVRQRAQHRCHRDVVDGRARRDRRRAGDGYRRSGRHPRGARRARVDGLSHARLELVQASRRVEHLQCRVAVVGVELPHDRRDVTADGDGGDEELRARSRPCRVPGAGARAPPLPGRSTRRCPGWGRRRGGWRRRGTRRGSASRARRERRLAAEHRPQHLEHHVGGRCLSAGSPARRCGARRRGCRRRSRR